MGFITGVKLIKQRLLMAGALAVFSQLALGDDLKDAELVCTVINSMGSAAACAVNESETAIDVTVSESVDDPAQFCSTFSEMVAMATTNTSDSWKMRIFTPESGDTAAADCDLN